ncbi:MAG: transposase [Synergistaceae bacterium]|nr:transposase [Synergistaceae bacterium]
MSRMHANTTPPGSYWDKRCEVLSSFLWLPTKRVLDDMPQSAANLEDVTPLKDTWFDSQIYSLPYTTHQNNGAQHPASPSQRSRNIRIYPNAEQREVLRHWMRTARYVYNRATECIVKGSKADWLAIKGFLLKELPEWTENVPFQIKAVAVRDACMTFKKGDAPRFRARSSTKQTIFVPKASVSKRGIYTRYLGRMDFAEDFPESCGDCRVILDGGRWFVSVPVSVSERAEHYGRVVSVDPGFRSFVTFYSLDSCGKIGVGAFSRIYSLCRYLDGLNERMAKTNHRQRYKMKKAAERLRWKIRNLVEELQHKTALFLVKNFDVIALPEFRAEDFGSGSLREIAGDAHAGFQEFLRAKAREYGAKVIAQNEDGTSCVCSWNGEARTAGRVIRDGAITLDRDYNGARGIFLRALRESAIPSPV